MNINLCDDETRFYIILENPTDEDKLKALKLVSGIFGIKKTAEKPEGVIPIKVEEPKLPPNAKTINLNASEKKKPDKIKIGYISTAEKCVEYLSYQDLNEEDRKTVNLRCSNFIAKKYMKQINENSLDDMKRFIQDFSKILEDEIKVTLTNYGFSNIDSFLDTAGENEIRSLYTAGKNSLYEKLNIKKTV